MADLADAFLADILAHPEDDTPRLVYADWLQDHGDDDSAAFIRAQIERARLDEDDPAQDELERREMTLLGRHPEWYADVAAWAAREATFRRGFLAATQCAAGELLRGAAALWRRAPVEAVALRSSPGQLADVLGLHPLGRLRELTLLGSADASDWQALAGWDASGPLRLHLPWAEATPDVLVRLLGGPLRGRLVELGLPGNNRLGGAGLDALIAAGLSERVASLDLHWVGLQGADLGRFAAVGWPRLRSLILSGNAIGDGFGLLAAAEMPALRLLDISFLGAHSGDFTPLFAAPFARGLTSLSIGGWDDTGAAFPAFLAAPGWPALRRLDLRGLHLDDSDARALAACPHLGGLASLDLGSNSIGPDGIAALVESPHLRNVRSLNLEDNWIDDAGVAALVRGLDRPRLTRLYLRQSHLSAEGACLLAGCPALANLLELDLRQNRLGAEGAAALAASPHLGRLGVLDVGYNHLGNAGIAALAGSTALTGVWELGVGGNAIGQAGWLALAASDAFPVLARLGLASTALARASRVALRARYGRAVPA